MNLIRVCLLTSSDHWVIDGGEWGICWKWRVSHGGSHDGDDISHHPCPATAGAFGWINAADAGGLLYPFWHALLVWGHPAAGWKLAVEWVISKWQIASVSVHLFTQVLSASVSQMTKRLTGKASFIQDVLALNLLTDVMVNAEDKCSSLPK